MLVNCDLFLNNVVSGILLNIFTILVQLHKSGIVDFLIIIF